MTSKLLQLTTRKIMLKTYFISLGLVRNFAENVFYIRKFSPVLCLELIMWKFF